MNKKTKNKIYTGILDSGIYSLEAAKLAGVIFGDDAYINIRQYTDKNIKVEIKNCEAPQLVFEKFVNEVLNQQCRIDLTKKNSKISRIIITKSLLSAIGEK